MMKSRCVYSYNYSRFVEMKMFLYYNIRIRFHQLYENNFSIYVGDVV